MNRIYLTQSNYNTFGSTPAILVVNNDIVISVNSVDFADGCIFEFDGGVISSSASGGTILNGSVQIVSNSMVQLFDNIKIPDLLNNEVPIEWFGGKCYEMLEIPNYTYEYSDYALANAIVSKRGRKILFQSGYYLFQSTVNINNSGIILSGAMSYNNIAGIRRPADYVDCVSGLVFLRNNDYEFLNITVDGTRLENLLLFEKYTTPPSHSCTAVELASGCKSIYVDRCMFYSWGKGIHKESTSEGLIRCIISECTFNLIKETAIGADVGYFAKNMIRDSWFTHCGCPVYIQSVGMIQDNTFDNCNFEHIDYYDNHDNTVYYSYGCCAIHLESYSTETNYATNNISHCYFEMIGTDAPVITSGNVMVAAVICLNSTITLDNNFFANVPRYFVIDEASSISINDNGIGIIGNNNYNLNHDSLIEVIQKNVSKSISQTITYSNAIPIPPSSNCHITKLVTFINSSSSNFTVRNLYELKFHLTYPPLL